MEVSDGAVSFLAASQNRVDVLLALRESNPADQRAVAESVDASRRTVKRTLDALADRGWVTAENGTGEYRVTALGDLVLDAYLDVVDRLSAADRLGAFLERVPAEAFDLDPLALADAEIVVRDQNQPYAPMDRVLELRRNADRIQEVVDMVQADSAGQLRERVEAGDLEADVVLQADVLDAIAANDGYADEFRAALAADGARFYTCDDEIPFVFGVMDDTVVLAATDDAGAPEAVVASDAPEVREWADARFQQYRDRATEITPDDPPA